MDYLPNTIIIGVQKAGTTSLHSWLSQHPEVYGPEEYKDISFFSSKKASEIEKLFSEAFEGYQGEAIRLHSYVNYILYPKTLETIAMKCPNVKLIAVLRNPIDRAISAYKYFRKMGKEHREPMSALIYEPQEQLSLSSYNNDFTYIEHGQYYKQLNNCLRFFSRDQILVIDFDDLTSNPRGVMQKIYGFLNLRPDFFPQFKSKNVTGKVRFTWVQNKLMGQSRLKTWIIGNLIDFWLPASKRNLLRNRVIDWNTSKQPIQTNNQVDESFEIIKKNLAGCFLDDTIQLDQLLGTNYVSKWHVGAG